MKHKGFSLIETVLYIGLFGLLIPSLLFMTLGFVQKSELIDPRIRMEEKAAIIFSELQNELSHATSVNVTLSTFGMSTSSLVYVDDSGSSVTIRRVNDTVTFLGVDQQVSRLQRQTAAGNEWITDADMNISNWNLEAVRDSANALTGINVAIELSSLNDDGTVYRAQEFAAETTVHLSDQTTEL